jgi:hypothetical protein
MKNKCLQHCKEIQRNQTNFRKRHEAKSTHVLWDTTPPSFVGSNVSEEFDASIFRKKV